MFSETELQSKLFFMCSPEPFSLQKIQPPVAILPSRLGQVKPPSIHILRVFSPNLFFKYLFNLLYLSIF